MRASTPACPMNASRTSLMLLPCLAALSGAVAHFAHLPWTTTAALTTGGVLLSGFVISLRGTLDTERGSYPSSAGLIAAIVLRLLIGVFGLSLLVLGLLWIAGLPIG